MSWRAVKTSTNEPNGCYIDLGVEVIGIATYSEVLSPITGFLIKLYEVRRLPNQYDAVAYRAALTGAERNRQSATGVLLRASAIILPVSALFILSISLPDRIWIAWVVTAYYALYASKFFVRAGVPPHPDEEDFSAVPQAG
jgi:hypothetical protein